MLTISRALGASQAESYHRSEFTSPEQSYYTKGNVLGEWQGRLAAEWGLVGEVTEQQFVRLANGQHPETGEALVRHRQSTQRTLQSTLRPPAGRTPEAEQIRQRWPGVLRRLSSAS